ncbi:flagellar filament capping protein FliD [Eubacterium oxidoreducens]|uniref:Flagellar hook-associated protein 2 n=1 Tax=Eubacterium oxidoreducens TaxID=1732 RepID=A0A1G6BRZ8_EUBOX|nr:flagellar filament capping protein FliD [Eubacterium oxidoreducens]SDB23356.1 flagellar hook-associated protein 2 [Eubacterium oxidoreducens]
MAIRMSGMISGLDTDAIVTELVSAYSTKVDKYKSAQTKLSWKQDAWKSLNTKIYSLYTSVGSMRYESAYNLKTTSVSDTTKATVTASSSAVNGTQSLKITSLAKSGYLTGGVLSQSGATTSTTLSDLGYTGGSGTININGTTFEVTGDTTIASFTQKLKDAGVNASLDTTNNRIFVSSKDSGTENEFTLTGADLAGTQALYALGLSTGSTSGSATYSGIVSQYGVFTDDQGNTYDASDYNLTYDESNGYYLTDDEGNKVASYDEDATSAKVQSLIEDGTLTASSYANSTYKYQTNLYNYALAAAGGDTTLTDKYTAYHTALDAVDEVKSALGDDYTTFTSLLSKSSSALESSYYDADGNKLTKTTSKDDDGNETVTYSYTDEDGNTVEVAEDDVLTGTQYLDSLKATAGLTDDDALAAYKENVSTISSYESSSLYAVMEKVGAVAAGTDEEYSSLEELADAALSAATESFMSNVSYAVSQSSGADSEYINSDAVRVDAQDATIILNGATFTSNSNTFTVNGLTITANALTGEDDSDAISITTSTDTSGIYDKVKSFLSDYNELINEMTSLYNASSAKGYEPLTDDEKEAMTETEIEAWEEKIKDALLRRDTTLSSITNVMTNAMASSIYIKDGAAISYSSSAKAYMYNGETLYDDDGNAITSASQLRTYAQSNGFTSYSLSSFGISTLGYLNAETNEQNAYHIDGDEDDDVTSGNTDKLMAMIQSDPDTVIAFMKQLSSNLYTAIDNKMKSTTLSSAYTVYNDKEMAQEYSDYTDTISDWEDKLEDLEDYYYDKFSAMETALAELQSKTSALSSLLGS